MNSKTDIYRNLNNIQLKYVCSYRRIVYVYCIYNSVLTNINMLLILIYWLHLGILLGNDLKLKFGKFIFKVNNK